MLVEPAAILQEVEEDQPFEQQLAARVGFGGREALILFEVGLDCIQRGVEAFEEVFGKRFFVESLRPTLEPSLGVCAIVLWLTQRGKVEFKHCPQPLVFPPPAEGG